LINEKGKPTKCGQAVEELQNKLPHARIVYCSATGCTKPSDMAYMVRLGLWGVGSPFPDGLQDFIARAKDSVGVMELVAMHLKRQGAYLCRTLSFEGCVFTTVIDAISDEQVHIYDEAARLWQELLKSLTDGLANGSLQFPLKKKLRDFDDEDGMEEEEEEEEQEDDDIGNKDALRVPEDPRAAHLIIFRYFWGAHQASRNDLFIYFDHLVG